MKLFNHFVKTFNIKIKKIPKFDVKIVNISLPERRFFF